MNVITATAIQRRAYWVKEISQLSDAFGANSERLEKKLATEIEQQGATALIPLW